MTFVRRAARILCLIAGISGCLFLCWSSGRKGIASLLSTYGSTGKVLAAADEAVRLSPGDPQAHISRAAALLSAGQLEKARESLREATALRPNDFGLWQEYARLCDLTNDEPGARAAYRRAVERAPNYAQPRWQLGNLLLRESRTGEAFAELRRAAMIDKSLGPNLVELAWGAFDGDPAAVIQAIEPDTDDARIELASLFIKRGRRTESAKLLSQLKEISEQQRNRLTGEMIDAHFFREAHNFMHVGASTSLERASDPSPILADGGFEKAIDPGEKKFGWRMIQNSPALKITTDNTQRKSGRQSLLFDWNDNVDAATPLAWKFVMAEPNRRYTLSFAAKTAGLVSGALPEVVVADAGESAELLSKPARLAGGTEDWKLYTLDFVAGEKTEAVRIIVRRQGCLMLPCPIFGKTWFDDFALMPVKEEITKQTK